MKMSDDHKFIIDTLAYYFITDELEKKGTINKETFHHARENLTEMQTCIINYFEVMKHEHIKGLSKTWEMLQNK